MQEGLARLAAMQAIDVIVGTGDMPAANALYDRFGFTEKVQTRIWRREGLSPTTSGVAWSSEGARPVHRVIQNLGR